MIEFAWPWVFLALPLPILAWWWLPRAEAPRGAALRVPFFESLPPAGERGGARAARLLAIVWKTLAWSLLVAAAAQPTWLGEPQRITSHGRDLMLALDLSGSMQIEDFDVSGRSIDRLSAVHAVAREFVERRKGDRVGLVLFGSRAYLQAPLTFDRRTVVDMIDDSEIGLAGDETAIGDAIGLAVKHLRDRPAEERVLVLLSDGASNAGALEPLRAAEIAAREGVRVYTIGIGSDRPVIRTPLGPRPVDAVPDEATLREVARLTGGSYFRARDTAGLVRAHRQIDALEKTEGEVATLRPTRSLFAWPLAGALGLTGLALLWRLPGALVDAARETRRGDEPLATSADDGRAHA